MRILHLVHRAWPYHGGAERYVLEHARAGVARGHECTICTTDAWDMSVMTGAGGRRIGSSEDVLDGVRILRFRVAAPRPRRLYRALARRMARCGRDRYFFPNPVVPGLHRWLGRERGFDLVHANAMPLMLYEGWRHARRCGAALASVPHANVGEKLRRVPALRYFEGCQERILRESTVAVAQSAFERDLFVERGVDPERVLVLGSGVDPGEMSLGSRERGLRMLGLEPPVVLSLTAHCRDRGTRELVLASDALLREGVRHSLVVAGPLMPDALPALEPAARGPLGEGRMAVTGYVGQRDRLDLLAAADVVVLPSRLDCFGIVLLEAWAMGRPVVGCWSGAMPDLVEDGSNGFLVPWGDEVTLADRLGILLREPDLARTMGGRGRASVLPGRTWESVTGRFYRRMETAAAGMRGMRA